MSEPKVRSEGTGGTTSVRIDGVYLDEADAQQVLEIQRLYYLDVIPRADYMKYLRRLKAQAESAEG